MKTFLSFHPILIAVVVVFSSCNTNHNIDWSVFDKNGTTIVYDDGIEKVKVFYKGEIMINDEETAFESMAPGSKVKYSKGNVDFEANSNAKGLISYFINGEKLTFNETEKSMVKEILAELSNVGIDAKNKCEKLYSKGGAQAVLSKIENLKSENVKSTYLAFLLDKNLTTEEEIISTISKIKTIESDFEKSNLLQKIKAIQFKAKPILDNYLAIAQTIESDFEKANVLKHVLNNADGSMIDETISPVLVSIDSDFEKKSAIVALLNNKQIALKSLAFVPAIIKTIDSDFEKAGALKLFFEKADSDQTIIGLGIEALCTIDSEFEKANIIKDIAVSTIKFNDQTFMSLIAAIDGIESDFEVSNVLVSLADNINTDAQWVQLIKKTEAVESAFERENVLLAFGQSMPKSQAVIDAFKKAAKSFDNDATYGKLIRLAE